MNIWRSDGMTTDNAADPKIRHRLRNPRHRTARCCHRHQNHRSASSYRHETAAALMNAGRGLPDGCASDARLAPLPNSRRR